MNQQEYQDNLEYLYSLSQSGIKLGLDNTRSLLNHFGNPQLSIPTIHIAGTNGKGSTSALVESILRASGYRVGLYTSPHLIDFSERIQINRVPIDQKTLCHMVSRIRSSTEKLNLAVTFFEFTTVLAFLYFQNRTDWNVIEVGLGGRLDATNLCNAEVSIITSISHDHTEHLGANLKEIAHEKASIIKNGGRVIANIADEEIFEVISRQSRKYNAPVQRLGVDFKAEYVSHNTGQKINYSDKQGRLDNLELPLLGMHQVANAALAISCCLSLKTKNPCITEQTIREGLKSTRWEGRLEVVGTNPTILLDCAHNPDGVINLTRAIREYFSYNRLHLVIGIMKDKPCQQMIEIISPIADRIILVKPKQERSWEPEPFKEKLNKCHKVVEIIEEIHYAMRFVRETSEPGDIICITGSIFTVAEAKQYIENEGLIKNNSDNFMGVSPP